MFPRFQTYIFIEPLLVLPVVLLPFVVSAIPVVSVVVFYHFLYPFLVILLRVVFASSNAATIFCISSPRFPTIFLIILLLIGKHNSACVPFVFLYPMRILYKKPALKAMTTFHSSLVYSLSESWCEPEPTLPHLSLGAMVHQNRHQFTCRGNHIIIIFIHIHVSCVCGQTLRLVY